MPHLEISQQSFTLALVAYANFTATPTTGCSINNLYAGLKGNLVDSLGANSVPVVVNSVPSAGVVQLLTLSDNGTRTSTDLTAYDGGSVYFETQLVWVESVNVGVDSAAGGDLSGTYPSPEVVALHDPDEKLSLGDIADGEFLKRSGNAIVSGAVDLSGKQDASDALTALSTDTTPSGGHVAAYGIRDTSAAYNVDLAATSSVALTAKRTLTLDMENASATLKVQSLAPATPTTPGTVPQYPIPQAGVDGLVTDLAGKAAGVTIANDFDPSVTGLAASIGVIAVTVDGSKAWRKWGAGNTQWEALHPVTKTFGAALASWDTTELVADLACDTLGPFRLRVSGTFTGAVTDVACITMRLNGAAATMRWQVILTTGNAAYPNDSNDIKLSWHLGAGSPFYVDLECLQPYSGSVPQVFRLSSSYIESIESGAWKGSLNGLLTNIAALPQAAIASIGLEVAAGAMGAACVATLTR